MSRASDERILRGLQILGNIFFPLILLGMLMVALIDWTWFNISIRWKRHRR